MTDRSVYRTLDAAADRGREAIRVIEDAVRFLIDDAPLTEQLKNFRHRYAELTACLPWETRLAARQTDADVGTTIEGAGEYRRESLAKILAANFCRLQESLRSLEEYSKLALPEMAHGAERLRYLSYTLQKDVCRAAMPPSDRLVRLTASKLYVLVTASISDANFMAIASAGPVMCQLRDKHATDRELYDAGKRLRALGRTLAARGNIAAAPLLIINDRADIARATDADGVHLGQSELPPAKTREIIGPDRILGLSTSDPGEANAALAEIHGPARVDYLGAGAVFATATKTDARVAGLDYLRRLADYPASVPIYAIGGINAENLPQVLETGIRRICVSSAVTGRPDMGTAAQELCTILTR